MPYALHESLELREQRAKLGTDVRALYRDEKGNPRTPTAEEEARATEMLAESEKLWKRIELMERADGLLKDTAPTPNGRTAVTDPSEERRGESEGEAPTEIAAALEALARSLGANAKRSTRQAIAKSVRDTPEYREVFSQYCAGEASREYLHERARQIRAEQRDLQVDNYTQAGALVPPVQFVNELLKDLDDAVLIRGLARKFTVPTAISLGVVKRTAKASTWGWGQELTDPTATKDTTLAFGGRELHPRHAAGLIKVSKPWLRAAQFGPEAIVRAEMARDAGELQENAFLTGSGSGRPLGVFTASADGISTARDVSTGNSTTAISIAGLRAAKYSIKQAYWPRLRWMGSRTFHQQLYSLDDGNGRPLLTESLKAGEVDMVLGFPVDVNEFAPNTFTTGLYVGILGDWSTYWIADALDMDLQRLDELYALTNQVGFIGRMQLDAMPVLEESWARVKLG
jgi:HK97 family phage major capsid protein